ncbi:MAG: LLM class F420-dependent oxidoreductase [Acidimicrobiaceae bacterium]|nr:LLM class F420-dependent oxidoreductase [Acidimicrobiaceae bacterium]MCH2634994.1 LLM class F420-dependent oxidoreductase [Acidimicrobiales bacterium]|tara:strand:+ start:695 stop:1585 length:891 start_codon:yes stop_codon:yes gene_type:complete
MTKAAIDLGNVGLWTGILDGMPSSEANELCAEAGELGFKTIWIPEAVGRDPFVTAMRVLENTTDVTIATGIANIYARDAMTMANAQRSIEEAHPGRFLLGLGVSHLHLVEWVRKHDYSKPLTYMRAYLEAMHKARFMAVGPSDLPEIVLAALGPKMLELAASETAGAHPYFVPPEHTQMARNVMGPDALLYPEQMVVIESDPDAARAIARQHMKTYAALPNYVNNLVRLGYEAEDVENLTDSVVDAVVVWGSIDAIAKRVQEHFDAGADHVCVQVLTEEPHQVPEGWRRLAPALID